MNTIDLKVVINYAERCHREAISENEMIMDGMLHSIPDRVRLFVLEHDNTDTQVYFQYSDENMYLDFIRSIDNEGYTNAAFYDDVTDVIDMWIEELAGVDVIIPTKARFWDKMDTR